MRRFVSIGIVLFTCILASAAYALPMIPIPNSPPSARNCVQSRGIYEADEPLFVAVVSGFFHDAPCAFGAPRVIVFKYGGLDPRKRVTLDVMIDGYPKTIFGENIYEIVGRLAEELNNIPRRTMAAAAAPLPDTPQPENGFGYIRVNARPYASVWVDGKDTGLGTPIVKHRLTVGRHTIRLVNSKMHCTGEYDVTIQPEQTTSLIEQLNCKQ